MAWIHANLNAEGQNHSLELVYGWSAIRVGMIIMLPVALSLAAGCFYMVVTDDVQTAWTISSYILSAVGGKVQSQNDVPPADYEVVMSGMAGVLEAI